MERRKKVVALIPARSGSMRIENKNLQSINGIPLLGIAIIQARLTETIDEVYVSTDSAIYAEVARNYGAKTPFLRPKELSDATATDYQVFRHFLEWFFAEYGYMPDLVVQVRATSPIREIKTIENCVTFMLKYSKFDSLRTISIPHQTPYKMWRINEEGRLYSLLNCKNDEFDGPSQVLPLIYAQDGVVDVVRSKTVMEKQSMSGDVIAGYTGHSFAWDIDLKSDLDKASQIFHHEKLLTLSSRQHISVNLSIIQGRLTEARELQCFPKNWKREFDLAREAGYTAIELFRDKVFNGNNPLWCTEELSLDEVKQKAISSGVNVRSICDDFVQSCTWSSLTAIQYTFLEELLVKASKIGCKTVVYPLLSNAIISKTDDEEAFIFYIKKLAVLAKSLGIVIALECNESKDKTLLLLRRINEQNIGYCLDIGNLYACGYDALEFIEDKHMASFICHIHIKDRNSNGENVVLGTGELDFNRIFDKLLQINYCGTLVCETNRGKDPCDTAKNNVLFLKKLLSKDGQ